METRTAREHIRTCAGCGHKAPQHELQRFHASDGVLAAGAGAGRGAYTCRRLVCFERALAQRSFQRVLRQNLRFDGSLERLYN